MGNHYHFSFEQLLSLRGDTDDDRQYVAWFKERTLHFATAAANKIKHISYLTTAHDQDEVWGDRFNPEYELRRAAASLIGLEERLSEAIAEFQSRPELRDVLEEALNGVKACKQEIKEDFAKANGWFVEVDSMFSGRLLE